jgi:hypothetical protein
MNNFTTVIASDSEAIQYRRIPRARPHPPFHWIASLALAMTMGKRRAPVTP